MLKLFQKHPRWVTFHPQLSSLVSHKLCSGPTQTLHKRMKIFCETAHPDVVLVWVYASAHDGPISGKYGHMAFITLFIYLYSACTDAAGNTLLTGRIGTSWIIYTINKKADMLKLSETTCTAVFPNDSQILLWTSPKKSSLKQTLTAAKKDQ